MAVKSTQHPAGLRNSNILALAKVPQVEVITTGSAFEQDTSTLGSAVQAPR